MNKSYSDLIDSLKSRDAAYEEFGDGFLLDHLERTYKILSTAMQPEAVCLAGLFYPIYDTEVFKAKHLTFDDRLLLQDLIGKDAEHLVWLSCKLDRTHALKQFCDDPAVT
jgi:hypothetical protein